MRDIFEKIEELEMPSFSKHEQIVNGILNAINEKILTKGDTVPSVNTMIQNLGFARVTIVKAYKELILKGVIESKNRLGYYVTNEDTQQKLKVALMMYSFDTFQEQLYQGFRNNLSDAYFLNVFFHHGNIDVFETIFNLIQGKYNMYVVSPIPHPKTKTILSAVPSAKFIMIDRYEAISDNFNYVTQEFEQSSYQVFKDLVADVRKFKKMVFFHSPGSLVPIEIVKAFKKFIVDFKINGQMLPAYIPGSAEKGAVYFTLDNSELWQILNDCKQKKLEPGIDVGILSHNDEPVKEIISGGITTYSANFALMGKMAALAVVNQTSIREIVPTVLIRRNSL